MANKKEKYMKTLLVSSAKQLGVKQLSTKPPEYIEGFKQGKKIPGPEITDFLKRKAKTDPSEITDSFVRGLMGASTDSSNIWRF